MSQSRMRVNLERVANRLNHTVAVRYGETFPFWYICEYPKAGGTWLGRMLADYMGIPFPQHTVFPIGCEAMMHNHWGYDKRLRRVFYLYRDGRDVMVSFYFMRMRRVADPNNPRGNIHRKAYEDLFGKGFDPDNIRANLPKFIEHEIHSPRDCRINWPDHIRQWRQPEREHVAYLSYEQLLEDAAGTLTRCLNQHGVNVDTQRLHESIDRYSFERVTGRKRGQEDAGSFLRKGVAGDWVNHFTKEAGEVFNQHCGNALVELGYESDKNWVDRHDFVTA